MLIGSLCAGYEGIGLGLERLLGPENVEYAFFCENDPDASRVLACRFPDVPNYGDLAAVGWSAMKYGNHKLDDDQKQHAVRLYESGSSIGQIAAYYGTSRQSMWNVLRRRTTMRPQLRYGTENHFYRGGSTADDRAQNLAERAIEKGVLVRPPTCEICGTGGTPYRDGRASIQAHHPDYNRPLDVMWLCKLCHHRWHQDHAAVPLRGGDEKWSPAGIDILTAGFP